MPVQGIRSVSGLQIVAWSKHIPQQIIPEQWEAVQLLLPRREWLWTGRGKSHPDTILPCSVIHEDKLETQGCRILWTDSEKRMGVSEVWSERILPQFDRFIRVLLWKQVLCSGWVHFVVGSESVTWGQKEKNEGSGQYRNWKVDSRNSST